MPTFRMVGRREIEVETQACIARIDYAYDPGFVFVNLFDKGLSENFTILTYDTEHSRMKLEKLVNEGASEEEAEFLRLIQSFSTSKTQASYFDRFAKGELTLEGALRAVKRKKKARMRYMAAKYFKEVERRFRRVCTVGSDWTRLMKVLYGEVGDSRLVLFVDRVKIPKLSYVVAIRDSSVALYWAGWSRSKPGDYITYTIFKCIVDGGRKIGRVLHEELELSESDFGSLLDFVKIQEERDSIVVHDRELYDYIKSIAAMNVIVGH
jgi:hypothetical protein